MKTIVEILVEEKTADNSFHAANMLNVLRCAELKTDAERLARCRLYKAWKMAGENKQEARRKAIAGDAVTTKDMFTLDDDQIAEETQIAIDNDILDFSAGEAGE